MGITGKPFVLCTIHRQENTDDPENLRTIFAALNEINREIRVVLPIHPRTRKIIGQLNIQPDFEPIDPVGYFDILELLKNSRLVITDSGGMQKEAYFFRKYCLTLREETEWTELVDHHFNLATGAKKKAIMDGFAASIKNEFPEKAVSLYGNGDASEKIVAYIHSL
jgi:UDP-GlcNAc3NAcA epimerase